MVEFQVEMIRQTPNPQQLIYAAMHQDYSEDFVVEHCAEWPSESKCGEIVVRRLLASDRGHYGCVEHPSISFNCGYFPHSVMQQIRTHRVGISFDCQSNRYTSKRYLETAAVIQKACDKSHRPCSEQIAKAVLESEVVRSAIESVVYLRPAGQYSDRKGHKYLYDESERLSDLTVVANLIIRYSHKIEHGLSPEHARGLMPFDVRQHWVMSLNVRSLMHLLDLRWKKDAQLECQQLCDLIWPHFQKWVPEIAEWYLQIRAKKARLAP